MRISAAHYWAAHDAAVAAGWHWPDATIPSLIDGDTIDAKVRKTGTLDVGFGILVDTSGYAKVRLRLGRINAPSDKADAGKASAAWLAGLLFSQTSVDLVTFDPYKYGGPPTSPGEWMCEVTLADGRNVSDLSVSLGFSVYWSGNGPRPGG